MIVKKFVRRGFTLIEVLFTLVLILILAAMSLSALRPGKAKAPSRGLAMALEEEFFSARQLAISSGHPVALGIPVDSGTPFACSVYRLEGWNLPTITWSKGFSGDYPGLGFAAAKWDGGAAGTWSRPDPNAPGTSVSKLAGFKLETWLPDDASIRDDNIFCFTPDGSLVTNRQWALDGRYTIVVGRSLEGGPGLVSAGEEPLTLLVSPYGATEIVTGVPGGTLPRGTSGTTAVSQPASQTFPAPGQVCLSQIVVTPRFDDAAASNEGVCVPGEYVTLEVYAYDPEGRGLFAKWKQPGARGVFTYPDGQAEDDAILASEVERMEYVHEAPDDLNWVNSQGNPIAAPTGGVFRARWTWTVPMDSNRGDLYEIQVDVKDAQGEAVIENPPIIKMRRPNVEGKLIVERWDPVAMIWQLVRLNPGGTNPQVLSPPGVEETMASIDNAGSKIAFLQDAGGGRKRVKIRPLDLSGGPEVVVSEPGDYTSLSLSPNGTWVSYRNHSTGQLITTKVNRSAEFTKAQSLPGATGIPRTRSGWSPDSQFLIYEHNRELRWVSLDGTDRSDHRLLRSINNGGNMESTYAPTSYTAQGQHRLLFSLGSYNPVLMSIPLERTGSGALRESDATVMGNFTSAPTSVVQNMFVDMDGGGGSAGSGSYDDCYPNVSGDSAFLVLNRTPIGTSIESREQAALIIPLDEHGNYRGGLGRSFSMVGAYRRPIWVP